MLRLFRKHPQLLLFGMLMAMFSSPGQTFLVSLFIPFMREEFAMTKTQIAGYYSAGTVVSAFLLPLTGRLLDRTPLVSFTLIAGFLLTLGCLLLSQSTGWLTVFIGFVLVRNLGQGTLTMISSTTMARVFGAVRGKALGISNMGYPLSEAIFPFMVTAWITAYGWRSGWLLLAGLTLVFFSPAAFMLLRGNPQERAREELLKTKDGEAAHHAPLDGPDMTLREVLRDPRFYILLFPMILAPSFLTALFFHQTSFIQDWKGWNIHILSGGFAGFGLVRAVMSFLSGPAVDRWGAKRVLFIQFIPLFLGLAFLLWGRRWGWAIAYLCAAGASMGISMTVNGALLAELFGTRYLASIKGVMSSVVVLSTAAAPVAMGAVLDTGTNPAAVLWVFQAAAAAGMALAWIGGRLPPPAPFDVRVNGSLSGSGEG